MVQGMNPDSPVLRHRMNTENCDGCWGHPQKLMHCGVGDGIVKIDVERMEKKEVKSEPWSPHLERPRVI